MTHFIAEISSNHNRDFERSLNLIRSSQAAGFDSVKFQLFKLPELFAPEILKNSEEHRNRSNWELPVRFLPELNYAAKELGLQFAATPFSLAGVEQLYPFVDFYKIASYELLWDDLLRAVAGSGKPVTISTGMATMEEVQHAVDVILSSGSCDLSILHCTSAYPAAVSEANLGAIASIRDATGLRVGWSDHTQNPGVIQRAVHRWGAEVVEMHIDLDGHGFEFGPGHCWLPNDAKKLIRDISEGFLADGDGVKEPRESELVDRDWRTDPMDGLRPMKKVREQWEPGVAT